MSQNTLNAIFLVAISALIMHAVLQHRQLSCTSRVVGFLLTDFDATQETAKRIVKQLDESDAL